PEAADPGGPPVVRILHDGPGLDTAEGQGADAGDPVGGRAAGVLGQGDAGRRGRRGVERIHRQERGGRRGGARAVGEHGVVQVAAVTQRRRGGVGGGRRAGDVVERSAG